MMRIFISRAIPTGHFGILSHAGIEADMSEQDSACPRDILLQRSQGADAVISQCDDRIDREFFDRAGPQLRIVANFASGFDNIDLMEAKRRGIIATNAMPEEAHDATTEAAIGLLFSLTRQINAV